jgi:hypothetical protein
VSGDGRDALEQQAVERVQELIAALEDLPEPAAAPARELVQVVLGLHGRGLARMLAIIGEAGSGRLLLERLALDGEVKGLLLLHGLHPEPLETRVHRSVERLRPHLAVLGVSVRWARIERGAVQIDLEFADARQLPVATLRREIEDAIFDAAPDAAGIAIEGLPAPKSEVPRAVVWSWSRDQPRPADRRA